MEVFTAKTVKSKLLTLNDWHFEDNAIAKQFKFESFSKALAFIIEVGLAAEKRNHHPELYNVYSKVKLRLTTHDSGGVTSKDVDLAAAIDLIK